MQPEFLPIEQARGTHAHYATTRIAGLDVVFAWQDSALVWLGLSRNDNAGTVARMKDWLPIITFAQHADTHGLAERIAQAWQADRLTDVPLRLYGTPFRLKVWRALLDIPANQPPTYGDIARKLGMPQAARAVGTSIGKNPISLLVPCHRVLPHNRKVGHYAWGTEIKSYLLAQEAA